MTRGLIDETTRRQTLGVLLDGAIAALGVPGPWGSEDAAARKRKRKSCKKRKQGKPVQQGKKHRKRKPCEKRDTPFATDPSSTLSPVCPAPSNATYVFQRQVGSEGTGNGQFDSPSRIDIAADGTVYVIDKDNHRIQRFSATGAFLSAWGSESGGLFNDIQSIAVSPDCAVFVTDRTNHRVQVFQPLT